MNLSIDNNSKELVVSFTEIMLNGTSLKCTLDLFSSQPFIKIRPCLYKLDLSAHEDTSKLIVYAWSKNISTKFTYPVNFVNQTAADTEVKSNLTDSSP